MGTILVNLDQTPEILWQQIDGKARRNVRRGIDQGIEIAEVSKIDGIRQSYDLNIQTSNRLCDLTAGCVIADDDRFRLGHELVSRFSIYEQEPNAWLSCVQARMTCLCLRVNL